MRIAQSGIYRPVNCLLPPTIDGRLPHLPPAIYGNYRHIGLLTQKKAATPNLCSSSVCRLYTYRLSDAESMRKTEKKAILVNIGKV